MVVGGFDRKDDRLPAILERTKVDLERLTYGAPAHSSGCEPSKKTPRCASAGFFVSLSALAAFASRSIVVAIPAATPTTLITWAVVAVAVSIAITVSPLIVVTGSIVSVGAIIVRLPPAASPLIADQSDLFDA